MLDEQRRKFFILIIENFKPHVLKRGVVGSDVKKQNTVNIGTIVGLKATELGINGCSWIGEVKRPRGTLFDNNVSADKFDRDFGEGGR